MIGHYDWAGGREALWRFGPDTGPVVVAALPLFEEANRTRTFVVTVMRMLAERGIAGVLPDLPGQGESLVPTGAMRLADMRAAMAAITGDYSFAVRSGAMLDTGERKGRWHLSPQGPELLRELKRMSQPGAAGYAGNSIPDEVLSEIEQADIAPARVARLTSDPTPADLRFDAAPLWRRAEPDNDPVLATLIADDIAAWVRACEA